MLKSFDNRKNEETSCILKGRKIPPSLLATLLVSVHFVFLLAYFEPAISTPDANGYFAQAKLIAREHRTYFETESDVQFVGAHWHRSDDDRYFSKYPPGFPAVIAVVFRIFGPEASLLINPLMASLSLFALFLICRMWLGEWWGLLASALFAFNPVANQYALSADSHTSTLFFLIWAIYFFARWEKSHSVRWAFGAGLFLGIIPAIRYPEILFVPAFVIFILLSFRGCRKARRSAIAGFAGFVIPFGALCLRNQLAFGAFWKTGYSLMTREIGFGWNYFTDYSIQYLMKLQSEGCGLLFGLGLIGITVMCARRDTWKRGVFFAALIVPVTLLYMSYFWSPDRASMRFLMPSFPVYTISSVWLLMIISGNQKRIALAVSAVLLFLTISWGLPLSIKPMQRLEYMNAALSKVSRSLKNHVDNGSIVISGHPFNQHLDFLGYWRLAEMPMDGRRPLRRFSGDDDEDFPVRQGITDERFQRTRDSGGDELSGTFRQNISLWSEGHRKVYMILSEKQLDRYRDQLSDNENLIIIDRIELPARKMSGDDMQGDFKPSLAPGGDPMGLSAAGPMRDRMPPIQQFRSQGMTRRRPGDFMLSRFDSLLNGEPLLLVEWKM
ncbi:MAG: hypothetical protein HOC71_11885 [Candidatus Latescibacteria bacterium]|jgi:hypothetical protein|nr:hypothetical protein [Candidatus Latescibacterota bacterium]